MTAYPCSRGRPDTSSLNFAAGETRPNNAIVATDDGTVCVYSDTDADILIDVTAAFGPNGLGLVPVDPVRLFDTRRTVPFAAGEIRATARSATSCRRSRHARRRSTSPHSTSPPPAS
jgi:hypothetical protein